jgi:hypothetical protein
VASTALAKATDDETSGARASRIALEIMHCRVAFMRRDSRVMVGTIWIADQ